MDRIEFFTRELKRVNLSPGLRAGYSRNLLKELAEREAKRQTDLRLKQHALEVCAAIGRGEYKKVAEMAEAEFGSDYSVTNPDGNGEVWLVTSHVAGTQHQGEYEFDTFIKAQNKMRTLTLYRLYDRYVRSGEVDVLTQLVVQAD